MNASGRAPRIAGHHFNDLLICPHRAWLAYHGNADDRVRDPAPLRSLQQAGIEHERAVYERLYPDAIRITERLSAQERYARTVAAMRAGVDVILQGYVQTTDGVGVLDVLTLVGRDSRSVTGHTYQVGEIKRSAILRTAHVFQASWYTELLELAQGQQASEAFFILADGQPQVVDLSSLAAEYAHARDELRQLRASSEAPGPHFQAACLTCPWRGVCLPLLTREQHPSLVPGVSRDQVQVLGSMGVRTWADIPSLPSDLLEEVGLAPLALLVLPEALDRLTQGRPPLRAPLRSEIIQQSVAVALEFPSLVAELGAGLTPTPTKVCHERGFITDVIPVSHNGDGEPEIDLSSLLQRRHLVTFGALDTAGLRRLLRNTRPSQRPRLHDLSKIIEEYLHYPAPGLDLETLYACTGAEPPERLSAVDRVLAVRRIIDWML